MAQVMAAPEASRQEQAEEPEARVWMDADHDHFGWEHLVVKHLERERERLVAVGHFAVLGEN